MDAINNGQALPLQPAVDSLKEVIITFGKERGCFERVENGEVKFMTPMVTTGAPEDINKVLGDLMLDLETIRSVLNGTAHLEWFHAFVATWGKIASVVGGSGHGRVEMSLCTVEETE